MLMKAILGLGFCLLVASPAAHAYVGPGLGLGVIGTIVGLLGAIALALFGVVYYPLKRRLARNKSVESAVPPEVEVNRVQSAVLRDVEVKKASSTVLRDVEAKKAEMQDA